VYVVPSDHASAVKIPKRSVLLISGKLPDDGVTADGVQAGAILPGLPGPDPPTHTWLPRSLAVGADQLCLTDHVAGDRDFDIGLGRRRSQ